MEREKGLSSGLICIVLINIKLIINGYVSLFRASTWIKHPVPKTSTTSTDAYSIADAPKRFTSKALIPYLTADC